MELEKIISPLANLVTAGAAVIGVWVAYSQLKSLIVTLKMNALTVVLQLESEMRGCKEQCDKISSEIRKEEIKEVPNRQLVVILNDHLSGCLENWLNSADRLAFCILKKYLEDKDWKSEYREYFSTLIKGHSNMFGEASIYTNIKDLNNKWTRE